MAWTAWYIKTFKDNVRAKRHAAQREAEAATGDDFFKFSGKRPWEARQRRPCAAANSFQGPWQLGSASFPLEPPDLLEVQTFLTAASEAEFEERKSMILTRLDACDPTVAEQLRRFWHNHKALVAHITAGLGHTIGPQEPCNSYDVAQTLEGEKHDAMCRPCYEKHHGLRSAMEPEVLRPCLAFSHWLQQKLVTDVPKDAKYKQYLLFRNGNQGTIVRLGGGTQLAGGTQLIFYPMEVEFGCLPVIGTLVAFISTCNLVIHEPAHSSIEASKCSLALCRGLGEATASHASSSH